MTTLFDLLPADGAPDLSTPEGLRRLMGMPFAFSPPQFEAITAPLAPQLVIAGAGSGKTTVMAARVVWLVATGQVEPHEVLGLTFTTKATHELASRIRDSLRAAGILHAPGRRSLHELDPYGDEGDGPEPPEEPTVSTYNAYAAGLLTEHGLRIGHEPDTRVIADASRYQLAARVIARYTGRVELLSDHPKTVIDYLLALDSAMTEHLVGPEDVLRFQAEHRPRFAEALAAETHKTKAAEVAKVLHTFDRREELLGLVESYRRHKQHHGLMDFSDQIELGARLASECPEVGELERAKYKVVLLDEYQDTSVAQALMLSRLFSGERPASGRGHAVSAVGDPNQAIYGWRGASVSNILRFGEDFPTAEGSAQVRTYPLVVNRRSDHRILQVANDLARPLYDAGAVQPLEAKPDAEPGEVRVAVHETYRDELAWLPEQVKAAHRAMAEPAWREIGVLARDNKHAADVFDALTSAEIPVEIVGLQGLLRLPEVAEVVATLTLLHDLTANAELLTLLTGPRWAIGSRDLALLGKQARALARVTGPMDREKLRDLAEELETAVAGADPTEVVSLADALEDPGEGPYSPQARERFALLAAELRHLRAMAGEPLLDLVRRIIDTTGIDVELASSVSPAAQARRDNLDLFVKAVAEFQAVDGEVTLPALLAYLQAEDEFGSGLDVATPTDADSVKLLTVHRAKGLEWDAVFLVGVAESRFPSGRTRTKWTAGPGVLPSPLRGDARDLPALRGHDCAALKELAEDTKNHELTEELRLGYVAVTRARHLLVVSSFCWIPDRKGSLGPSPYQETIKATMASWGAEPEVWQDKPAKDDPNPLDAVPLARPWPMEAHLGEVERRREAADRVRESAARLARGGAPPPTTGCPRTPRSWSPAGTPRSTGCSRRRGATGPRRSSYRCRRACPRPRSPGSATSPSGSPPSWPGRCRASRRPAPGSAPGSTRGSRPGSASSCCSTPTSCPAAGTTASTTTPTWPSWWRGSRPARSPTGCRWRSSRRSRWSSTGRWSAAGSTRSTPTTTPVPATSWSWTGRPTSSRPPTRCSSRSTGWRGPSCRACRSSRCGRRSTTSAPATWSSRPAWRTAPGWRRSSAPADRRRPGSGRRQTGRAPAGLAETRSGCAARRHGLVPSGGDADEERRPDDHARDRHRGRRLGAQDEEKSGGEQRHLDTESSGVAKSSRRTRSDPASPHSGRHDRECDAEDDGSQERTSPLPSPDAEAEQHADLGQEPDYQQRHHRLSLGTPGSSWRSSAKPKVHAGSTIRVRNGLTCGGPRRNQAAQPANSRRLGGLRRSLMSARTS